MVEPPRSGHPLPPLELSVSKQFFKYFAKIGHNKQICFISFLVFQEVLVIFF